MGGSPRAVGGLAKGFVVVAVVDFGVGVSQFDGNITFQFVLETDGLHTTDGFHEGGFSVSDVTNGSDVDGRLTGNLGGQEAD